MQNITGITNFGKNSFAKANRVKPRAYRRKSPNYAAFTIKGSESNYIVRIAQESRRVLAECVNLTTGEPCKGFYFTGHCFHLTRAITLLTAEGK